MAGGESVAVTPRSQSSAVVASTAAVRSGVGTGPGPSLSPRPSAWRAGAFLCLALALAACGQGPAADVSSSAANASAARAPAGADKEASDDAAMGGPSSDRVPLAPEPWEDRGGIGADLEPGLPADDASTVPEDGAGAPATGRSPGGVPAVAPAPRAARLTRLTEPGCCTLPEWSADGRRVLFIDRPRAGGPTGIWAVSPESAGAAPELVTEDIARYSDGLAYRYERAANGTSILRLADGRRWELPTSSGNIRISPDGRRVAWLEAPESVPSDRRTARVWVRDLAGGERREVATLPRGSLSGWLGNDALLLRGRESIAADDEVLWVLSLTTGQRREIARGRRLRGELTSPDGRWVAYYVTQQPEPEANGLWLVGVGGGPPRRLDDTLFGAYAWRDGGRLLIVPLDATAPTHRLLELDAQTLGTRELVNPAAAQFTIANGDWTVSPDGRFVAFVEQRDKAIWVIELP